MKLSIDILCNPLCLLLFKMCYYFVALNGKNNFISHAK